LILVKIPFLLLSKTISYFWRTYDQKEIDLIEEADGHLHCYEFK